MNNLRDRRQVIVALVVAAGAALAFKRVAPVHSAGPVPLAGLPLVQPNSLEYQGTFRVPLASSGDASFAYGGTALAFNPARGSLYLVGHDWRQQVAEISVPDIRKGAGVEELATAAMLQPLTDATEGKLSTVNPADRNGKKIGGLLPYGDKLYISGFSYYDGGSTQVLSHFVSGQDLSVKGDVKGPYQVGTVKAGYVSGYMAVVPAAWQAPFGGPALTGNCCLAVTGRTSQGPAISAFNPADLGVKVPAPASPLLYYDEAHLVSGSGWGITNPFYNGTTRVTGVVMPEGTRSVLFFGRHGTGKFCYGAGTTNQSLDGTLTSDHVTHYCYDPEDPGKGTHGYPFVYQVWAYDALDLAAVKGGHKRPWQIKPYAVWKLEFPFVARKTALIGAAYDPATGRIFLVQGYAEGDKPLIHVFSVNPRQTGAVS